MDFSQLSQAEIDGLFAFLQSSGLNAYAGGIAPKNGFNSSWSNDLDIRIQQDFRLWNEHALSLFFDIENVLNLFSDSKNVKKYADTGDVQEAVRVLQTNEFNANNQFEVEAWFDEGNNRDVDDSVYRIQFGIRYRF